MFKSIIAATVLLASAVSAPAMAGSRGDQILGAAIGAAAGAVVGNSVGGRDGAVVGGALGGLVGASIGGQNRNRHDDHYYGRDYDRRYVDYRGHDGRYDRGYRQTNVYVYEDNRRGRGHGHGHDHGHRHDRYCRD